jgi:hypothetical protein
MNNTPSNLIKDPNLVFDAFSLKEKIKEKLNSDKIFTDHNYEGSNLSSLIDIISYSFSSLLFYLNKNSSETMFTEAQIYENMNRIVKILNYNPLGRLTQTLPIQLLATPQLTRGAYLIPRYSMAQLGNIIYSFKEDIAFSKLTDLEETVIDNSVLLHQGSFQEYPTYIASGVDHEVIYLGLNFKEVAIDHFGIHVYVKSSDGRWERWTRAEDRTSASPNDKIYEVRFNHNKRYEISFGDDINGRKLYENDLVAIYYLKMDIDSPVLGANSLNNDKINLFNSVQYAEIIADTKTSFGSFINSATLFELGLYNNQPASPFTAEENVEAIRNKAPKVFRSQHRLITSNDYSSFIKANFSNLISDCYVVNNEEFLAGHIKYLYDIGLRTPQSDSQVLFNQVKFANSCNFNNVYLYIIPKAGSKYLSASQKELILNEVNKYKTLTAQIVPMDPEYMYFDFFVPENDQNYRLIDLPYTKLRIRKHPASRRADSAIKFDISNIFLNYFNKNNYKIDSSVNTYQLTTDILNVEGVQSINTFNYRSQTGLDELSFLVWNSKFPESDAKVFTQTVQLDYYKFPLLYSASNLIDRIEILDSSNSIKIAEF